MPFEARPYSRGVIFDHHGKPVSHLGPASDLLGDGPRISGVPPNLQPKGPLVQTCCMVAAGRRRSGGQPTRSGLTPGLALVFFVEAALLFVALNRHVRGSAKKKLSHRLTDPEDKNCLKCFCATLVKRIFSDGRVIALWHPQYGRGHLTFGLGVVSLSDCTARRRS